MTIIKLGAAALALTLSLALPVESPTTAQLFGAPAAQAGVWGSIKGAAKKVGGAAKSVGSELKNGAPNVGSAIRRGAGAVANGAKAVGSEFKNGAPNVGSAIRRGAGGVADGAKAVGGALIYPLAKAQDALHDKYTPKPAPRVGKPLPKPPAGQPGSWGGQQAGKTAMARPLVAAPNHGIAKPNLGIARDKSAWGRPVGVGSPKGGGFAAKDIRPMAKVVRSHRR